MSHFGKIEFTAKDLTTPGLRYDRLALGHGNQILMLSVVAEDNFIKSVRACLNGAAGGKLQVTASNGRVSFPNLPASIPRNPGNLNIVEGGYFAHKHRLEYGLCHALFITKSAGFMPAFQDESLWRELLDTKYTTPLLREWLPYVQRELIARELLKYAESFGCRSGVLAATNDDLDDIVSRGIKHGEIAIPS